MQGLPGFEWEQEEGAAVDDGGFEEGLGTTFGYQDPGESPVGAWGDFLDSPDAYGVALPRAELRRIFGDEDKAHNAIVEVQNPATGQTIRVPIIDKGPAEWVLNRQGPTIDLTEGAYRQIGMKSRLEPLRWKVVGHEGGKTPVADAVSLPEGFSWEDNGKTQPASAEATTGLPEGFEWESQPPRDYGENLNPDLTGKLSQLEQTFGPLKVNSGYRDAEHNRKVGGAPGSQHVHGNAVDIDTSGMSQTEQLALIEQASASGITGIGVYGNSLHFDVGNRRAWGPSYGIESVPKWAESTIVSHLAGTARPQEQGGGDTLPTGFQWEEEEISPAKISGTTPTPTAVPAEAPPSRQEQAAYNRSRLKTAIEKTEASGFPVPHTIGKPDEPEGDRAPTRDMENLVEALKQAEKAKVSQGDKAGAEAIAGERTYWEDQIKTTGMSEEQEMKSLGITSRKATRATPEEIAKAKQPEPVEPQIGLGTEMKARAAGLKKEEELPQVSTQVADQLGLEAWRDLHSGIEIRRPIKEKPPDAAKRAKEQAKTFEEQITPDVLPEWRALAPGAGQEDYRPEWTQPVTKQGEEGKALQDNLSLFLRGGSSEGVLAALEGGYAAAANNLPEGPIRDNAIKQRDEVAIIREQVRKGLLPVDKEAEMSIIGQLFQGAGQLVATLPAYAIAPIGGAVSVLQLYDEARQDYIQTMKEQGKPADEASANRAALEYLTIAGPADVAMDVFIVGKFLKRAAKAGDKTIGQVAADLGKMAGSGGLSEATQEAWLNKVANWFEGYDPDRPWTRSVWEAFIVGAGLGGGAGAIAIATEKPAEKPAPGLEQEMKARFPIPPAEQERLDALKKKMEEAAAQKRAAPGEPTPTTPGFTMQPTSDKELARMQAEYEGKPVTPDEDAALDKAYEEIQKGAPPEQGAVAGRAAPEISRDTGKPGYSDEYNRIKKLDKEGFKKEALPVYRAAQDYVSKLGLGQIRINPNDDAASARVGFDPDGTVYMEVQPVKLAAGNKAATGPSGTYTQAVLGEETYHAAHILGIKLQWENEGGLAKSGSFQTYVDKVDRQVFDDIQNTVNAANPREKQRLLQALSDSYQTYFGKMGQEMLPLSLTHPQRLENIFKDITSRGHTLNFIEEFLRQAAQLKDQGVLSETVTASLFEKIGKWVKEAINRVVKALPGIREGHFGKQAQDHLKMMEDNIAKFGVKPPELVKGRPKAAQPYVETEADRKAAEIKERLSAAVRRGAKYREVEEITGELAEVRKAQAAMPVREGPATVNIGMETDDGRGITEQQVLDALEEAGVDVRDYRIETSTTGEKTVVAHLEQTLDETEAFALARTLNQEAIAEKWMGGAELYGPKAEAWKPFNEAYFLSARGTPVTLAQSLDYLETLAKDYAKWKDWYDNFDAFLNRILGDNIEYKPLITDFMASMSQMGKIGRNVDQMIDKLQEFMETGSITRKGIDFPATPKFGNLLRAMEGLALKGPKVGPFSDAMRGIRGAAAIDRHVAMVLFGTRKPTDAQIRKGKEVSAQIAQRLGWDTRQVQAAWWAAGKELYGERGKVVETYEQYLEQWRERLNAILTKDREGAQRGLQAARRIHERTGEAAGVPGTGGIAAVAAPKGEEKGLIGAREGPEITPAFEKFFGESKVTYPTGSPKPVYHATRGDFDVFIRGDIGYHFGTVTAAEDRAKHMLGFPMVHPPAVRNLPRAKGMNIMKGWLRIERPLRLPDLGSWWPDTVIPALREQGLLKKEHDQTVKDIFSNWNKGGDVGRALARLIESFGYDGIVYRNTAEGRRTLSPEELQAAVSQIKVERTGQKEYPFRAKVVRPGVSVHTLGMTEEEVRTEAAREAEVLAFYVDDSFIAFHSNQFKSATGNVGAYDFGNPSMIAAPAAPPVTPTAKPRVNRMINIHSVVPKKTVGLTGKARWGFTKGPAISPSRLYRSTRKVFENTPGYEWVAKAISKHIDLRAKYKGKYGSAAIRPLKAIPLLKRKAALEEFQNFITVEQEQGPAAAAALTLTPHARSLVDAAHRVLDELGDINQKNNVHVFDPKIGAFRPIGKVGHTGTKAYFPRMFKQSIMEILHNPAHNPAAWEDLKTELIAAGKISAANADQEMANYVDDYMQTYRANGFFGSLDMARSPFLPNMVYDYSYGTFMRYIESWSERMSQIEAFGQKLGKQGKDLFDRAQEQAGDDSTKKYINRVRDLAYNAWIETSWARALAVMNNIGTTAQLANFGSTIRNLMSGMGFNWQNLGTIRFLYSFANIRGTWREISDGLERGVLMNDLFNVMQDGTVVGEKPTKTGWLAGKALQLAGFTGAETWVRGVAMVGARSMLRSAIKAYNRNKRSAKTRKWLAYFKRLGLDGEALILEGGQGDLFDSYMRASVNEIQGGYTYAHVPAFMDEPQGRFLLKYQKWGVEQFNHFNDGALKPFIRAVTARQAFKETVEITNAQGQKETLTVPGAFMPMARYLLLMAAVGAGTEWLLEQIFGRFSKTASIAEIMSSWRRDKALGFAKAMDKLWGFMLTAGAFGALGNYVQVGWDYTQRKRFKSPLDPPGLQPFVEAGEALMDLFDAWPNIGTDDLDRFLTTVVSQYRTLKQMGGRTQDVLGNREIREFDVTARRQDYGWLRSVTRRYDKEIGARENVRSKGRTGRSPTSLFRDRLFEDLILGDRQSAARRLREHLTGMSEERAKIELANLRQSVGGRQPIKAGAGGGDREAMRVNFLEWARKNLSRAEVLKIERIDRTYRRTAQSLDLMKADEDVEEVDLEKAMRRLRVLAQ